MNTFQRFYHIDKRHVSLETDMDGMALNGDHIPSLGNQELLVRLIFGIGMAFSESFSLQKRNAFNCMKRPQLIINSNALKIARQYIDLCISKGSLQGLLCTTLIIHGKVFLYCSCPLLYSSDTLLPLPICYLAGGTTVCSFLLGKNLAINCNFPFLLPDKSNHSQVPNIMVS